MLAKIFLAALFLLSGAARAQADGDALTSMINAYRKAPGACQDGASQAVAALQPKAALAALRIKPGASLASTLAKAGYPNAKADAISVRDAATLQAAFAMLRQSYCRVLLNGSYTDIGASRHGGEWTVVLARATTPLPSDSFASWQEAGEAILESVNAARAAGQVCGDRAFPPAPPLRWNARLGWAALVHSGDMAEKRYFSHADQSGRRVGDRAREAGYSWARVGENLAYGLNTPQETVNGWLSSPSHCANIMNGEFTEMGAAFAVTADDSTSMAYWTQTFGKPRM